MWIDHFFMKTEDLGDKIRLYFNYEEEQNKARQSFPNLEENPHSGTYTDFDYIANKSDLPHILVIPEIDLAKVSAQIGDRLDFIWAIKNGAMLLGNVAVFKTVDKSPGRDDYVVVRMCVGLLSCSIDAKSWEGQQLQYI